MMPSLLNPLKMLVIYGIKMPLDFYVVLREPLLLAGMSYPGVFIPRDKMKARGFSRSCLPLRLGGLL